MGSPTSATTSATAEAGEREAAPSLWHPWSWRLELPTATASFDEVRPLLIVLGLPTLGLSFAITILTTYGPLALLKVAHSPAKVGLLIGGEGAFALAIPLLAGTLSDRLPASTPGGRRMPFVIAGAPLAAAGLALLPFVPTYGLAGLVVLFFFVGYYLYYPPYRAIYADLLPRRLFARAQSGQAVARGAGLGVALLSGGLLIQFWSSLPFVFGAGVLVATTFALKPVFRLQQNCAGEVPRPASSTSTKDLFLHNRKMQLFAVANMCWEFSFAGLKVFIALYVTKGLGKPPAFASAVIAIVAVAYVIGAPIAGRLADRFGIVKVMLWSAAAYGVGLCYGVLPHSVGPMAAVLPFFALAGAILMTLPQALAFTVAPDSGQGAAAGLVDFSRGVGLILGPIAVGAAVSASSSFFSSTHGYAAMWPTIGVPVLLSLLLLRRL